MLRAKSPQNLAAGLLFIVIGLVGLLAGLDLAIGTTASMGPGYFPILISSLIVAVGIAVTVSSLVIDGPTVRGFGLRPMLFVNVALLLFGFAIESFGLAMTTLAMTLIAALSRDDTRWRETIIVAIGLSAFAVVLFIYLLGQPMRAWWEF